MSEEAARRIVHRYLIELHDFLTYDSTSFLKLHDLRFKHFNIVAVAVKDPVLLSRVLSSEHAALFPANRVNQTVIRTKETDYNNYFASYGIGLTPIQLVINHSFNSLQSLRILLDAPGIDILAVGEGDNDNRNALQIAVSLMLDEHAHVLLEHAQKHKDPDVLKKLINHVDNSRGTALRLAASKKMKSTLIDLGANCDLYLRGEWTPLNELLYSTKWFNFFVVDTKYRAYEVLCAQKLCRETNLHNSYQNVLQFTRTVTLTHKNYDKFLLPFKRWYGCKIILIELLRRLMFPRKRYSLTNKYPVKLPMDILTKIIRDKYLHVDTYFH